LNSGAELNLVLNEKFEFGFGRGVADYARVGYGRFGSIVFCFCSICFSICFEMELPIEIGFERGIWIWF
jgi:hypothetical protein